MPNKPKPTPFNEDRHYMVLTSHEAETYARALQLAEHLQSFVPPEAEKHFTALCIDCHKDEQSPRQIIVALLGSALDWYKSGN